MTKLLNGSELAGYIKERHAKQVRSLKASKILPKLAIVQVKDDPAINAYVNLKKKYGADIGVEVEIHTPKQSEVTGTINQLNSNKAIQGIIIQLPLTDPSQTDEVINLVTPDKDVDALGVNAKFEPATANAILWLLAGYGVSLAGKKVLLIGRGRLVGAPLEKVLKSSGIEVMVVDGPTDRLPKMTDEADVIIAGASTPGILNASMIKPNTVVVDAGVAGEDLQGNVSDDVYERDDLIITPKKGGVGPLTVCALFDNLIKAAQE